MQRLAYKKLKDPSERELNDLAARGWRIVAVAPTGTYGCATVFMERFSDQTAEPNEGRP